MVLSKVLRKLSVYISEEKAFSVYELMISLSILSILSAAVYPSFSEFYVRKQVEDAAWQIANQIRLARNNSIMGNNQLLFFSPNTDCDPSKDASVFNLFSIRELDAVTNSYKIIKTFSLSKEYNDNVYIVYVSNNYLSYDSTGQVTGSGRITVCDRKQKIFKYITISTVIGRVKVSDTL